MTFTERIEGGIGTTREKRGKGRGRNYRVAAEQEREIRHSLGASSPGCSGGRVGKRRTQSLQLHLWNLNSTSNYPVVPCWLSCQIYDNQREEETSANVEKYVPRVMTSLLMSSPPISISHRIFRCRNSNSWDIVASSPSFSHPTARVPWMSLLAG